MNPASQVVACHWCINLFHLRLWDLPQWGPPLKQGQGLGPHLMMCMCLLHGTQHIQCERYLRTPCDHGPCACELLKLNRVIHLHSYLM